MDLLESIFHSVLQHNILIRLQEKLTFKQFQHRIKFQDHPLLSMAAGLEHPRHDALILMAAYMHKNNMMQHLDEVTAAMKDFDDDAFIDRIKNKKIHEKYDVGSKAII